jgi:hypothetical protein
LLIKTVQATILNLNRYQNYFAQNFYIKALAALKTAKVFVLILRLSSHVANNGASQ